MPFLLDALLDELVVEPPEEEPPEGWVEPPDAWVDRLLVVVAEPELEEFEPQAATPRATRTSRAAASRRGVLVMDAFIIAPLVQARKIPGYDLGRLSGGCCSRTLARPPREEIDTAGVVWDRESNLTLEGFVKRAFVLTVPMLVTSVLLAACGSSSKTSSASNNNRSAGAGPASATTTSSSGSRGYGYGGSAYGGSGSSSSGSSGSSSATMVSTKHSKLGMILDAGSKQLTVYLFEKDRGPHSSCSGACSGFWPPVTTRGKPDAVGGALAADLGTITRPDGTKQVTYKGHPLYYFAKDKDSGDAYGEGMKAFGAEWYVLAPSGSKVDNS